MIGFGPVVTVLIVLAMLFLSGITILKKYERAVVFRFGRMVHPRGPGIAYIIPLIGKMIRVDLRIVTMDIPSSRGSKAAGLKTQEAHRAHQVDRKLLTWIRFAAQC